MIQCLKYYLRNFRKRCGCLISRLFFLATEDSNIRLDRIELDWSAFSTMIDNSDLSQNTNCMRPYRIFSSSIGAYSYVAPYSHILNTTIGKFCSIGPHFLCGWGIHPTDKLSAAPMFYSTLKQNGMTLSKTDKIVEHESIQIGNDVFIGANVTILDGVSIGDGAIIGAGAVVCKDVPSYAIVGGVPAKLIRYRFAPEQIDALLKIRWWNFPDELLPEVERYFDDVEGFIQKYYRH